MKRSAPATLRRTVRRTVGWRPKRLSDEPVDIGRLISPLRYDVFVRAQFFQFLDRHLDLYRADFRSFADAARQEPYFVWFEHVAMSRFRPWVAKDQQLLVENFDERIQRSYALWTAFRRAGLDPKYPVTLRTTEPGVRTDTGWQVSRRLHVGDGCHRVALLLASGERVLRPELYRIDRTPLRRLLDNTDVLVRALELDEASYARFLSLGYADEPQESLPALIEHVRERRPDELADLVHIVSAFQTRRAEAG